MNKKILQFILLSALTATLSDNLHADIHCPTPVGTWKDTCEKPSSLGLDKDDHNKCRMVVKCQNVREEYISNVVKWSRYAVRQKLKNIDGKLKPM